MSKRSYSRWILRILALGPVLALGLAAGGCGLILGLDQFSEAAATTGTGTGTGGGGAGGGPACQSGATLPCDTGLKGACAAGTKTCLLDQTGYGDCAEKAQPTASDDCVNKIDTTCDGAITCGCIQGTSTPCMTSLKAECAAGTATCKADGTGYDACVPDVMPTVVDDCVSLKDTNCNGVVDCVCQSAATQSCPSGLLGACAAGTQSCTMDGTGYGACAANVQPGMMPEDCQSVGDEDCDGIACSDNDWSFLAGDASSQVPTSVAIDSSGNIFVAGDFSGTLKLLDKVNATSITLTASGVSTDYFLAKFTPAGDVIWAKNFGVGYPSGTQNRVAVAVDASGNVGIAGELHGVGNFGGGNISAGGVPDIFVAKFDPQGVYKWARAFGSSGYSSRAYTLAFDSSGNVLIGGSERALSLNMDGISLDCSTNPLTYEAFIAKLTSATGAVTWAKQYKAGTTNGDKSITRLVLDGSDNIYMTGVFAGSIFLTSSSTAVGGNDAFVAKLNSSGVVQWGKAIGTAQMEDAQDIALDAAGNVLITGSIGGSFNFGGGTVTASGGSGWAFLAKYTILGAYTSAKIFANSAGGSALGVGVTTDVTNNVYLSGSMVGGTNLGGGVLANGGANDIFLGKFDSSLNPLWSKSFGDGQSQKSTALRFDKSTNRVVLAGTDAGNVNFGTGALTGMDTTTTDLALASFQP